VESCYPPSPRPQSVPASTPHPRLPKTDRRRRAPGLTPPMVSPPYHLRRPTPHPICHCKSKPIPSPPLRTPHRSLCSSMAPELPPRAAVDCVPSCLAIRFAGPRQVTERRPDSEPRPMSSHRCHTPVLKSRTEASIRVPRMFKSHA
jgi:hypothetical protein